MELRGVEPVVLGLPLRHCKVCQWERRSCCPPPLPPPLRPRLHAPHLHWYRSLPCLRRSRSLKRAWKWLQESRACVCRLLVGKHRRAHVEAVCAFLFCALCMHVIMNSADLILRGSMWWTCRVEFWSPNRMQVRSENSKVDFPISCPTALTPGRASCNHQCVGILLPRRADRFTGVCTVVSNNYGHACEAERTSLYVRCIQSDVSRQCRGANVATFPLRGRTLFLNPQLWTLLAHVSVSVYVHILLLSFHFH